MKTLVLLMAGVLFLGSFCLTVSAETEETYFFESPEQRRVFKQLTQELRCPKCQNQNIADSDALVAQDLKRKTYQLMQQGYDKQQVVDYMKQRYGDFVYYQPPLNPATLVLWLGPLVFILLAGAVVIIRRRNTLDSDDTQLLAKAEQMLGDKAQSSVEKGQ